MNARTSLTAVVAVAAAATGLAAAAPESAHADERVCRGTIGAVTLDNIRVPQGATCTLDHTTAKGTVLVERGATLTGLGVRVVGNVQAEGAHRVKVVGRSRVGGSIQVKQGGSAIVRNTHVDGDLQYDANSRMLRALANTVGGSVQIMQNSGGVEVSDNRIDGNLQCKQNNPRPFGGGNIVGGNKEDQCARL